MTIVNLLVLYNCFMEVGIMAKKEEKKYVIDNIVLVVQVTVAPFAQDKSAK